MKLSAEERDFIDSLGDFPYTVAYLSKWAGLAENGGAESASPEAAAQGYLRAVRGCLARERRRQAAVVQGLIHGQGACLRARESVAVLLQDFLRELSYRDRCAGINGCTEDEENLLTCIIAWLREEKQEPPGGGG